MFGNWMDNMKEKQDEMKKRLANVYVDSEIEDGAIKITANANRKVIDIKIDPDKIDTSNVEQLEDLLVIAINEVLDLAGEREASEAEGMIKDMLPGGLSGLFGMK